MSTRTKQLLFIGRERLRLFRAAVSGIASYSFEHLMFLGGLTMIAYGAWMIYRPAGFIVGGWLMVKIAFLVSAERGR